MKRLAIVAVVLIVGMLAFLQGVQGQPQGSVQEKIRSAMSAAPLAIARNATILDYPAKEGDKPPVLRKGTNGWTCFPKDPTTPANDPQCYDKMGMVWLEAYLTKSAPNLTNPGVSYMLRGGADPSNTDPFAPPPASKKDWMFWPPHIMVFVPGKLDRTVLTTDPKSGGPWIMWAGTPYEHLMIPVK